MQLAPVFLFFADQPLEAIVRSADSSRTTHGAVAAVDAYRYLGALIVGAVEGASKDELAAPRYSPVRGYWDAHPPTSEIDRVASGSFLKGPPDIMGSGHVVRSLETALWAFFRSDRYREGCLMAVNLGDDADTTGAVYGQLAVAYYGGNAIPSAWLGRLARRQVIEDLADKLHATGHH